MKTDIVLKDQNRFLKYINKKGECWIWSSARNNKGYGFFSYKGKATLAHRFSYEVYVGNIKKGFQICHICDNPACVNPKHLFMGTQIQNMKDCVQKKRNRPPRGEKHPSAKLTINNVKKIRKMYETGNYFHKELGIMFGVTKQNIGDILNYKIWKQYV